VYWKLLASMRKCRSTGAAKAMGPGYDDRQASNPAISVKE
jgi:hypothetical protein